MDENDYHLDGHSTWGDPAAWLKLGDNLAALQKISNAHARLETCTRELYQQKARLFAEVSALKEQRDSLQAEITRWESRTPNIGLQVPGLSDVKPSDPAWLNQPRLVKPDTGPGKSRGPRLLLTAPAYTYALFDDSIMYIGFTKNWRNRKSGHHSKGYTEFVLQGWPTVGAARQAENAAIHDRHPRLNNICTVCGWRGTFRWRE